MLETKNLTYQYDRGPEIHFPDFDCTIDQPLLICGESGCGKTTLLHLLSGLLRPKSGEILFDASPISTLAPADMDRLRGSQMGMVFQNHYFVAALSVLDNLLISPFSNSKGKAIEVAERLNIEGLLKKYPHQLSVGQQQRVNIARAVLNTPKVIFADEPTSALDNKNCHQVLQLLTDEAQHHKAALVIVTHDDRVRTMQQAQTLELEPLNQKTQSL